MGKARRRKLAGDYPEKTHGLSKREVAAFLNGAIFANEMLEDHAIQDVFDAAVAALGYSRESIRPELDAVMRESQTALETGGFFEKLWPHCVHCGKPVDLDSPDTIMAAATPTDPPHPYCRECFDLHEHGPQ